MDVKHIVQTKSLLTLVESIAIQIKNLVELQNDQCLLVNPGIDDIQDKIVEMVNVITTCASTLLGKSWSQEIQNKLESLNVCDNQINSVPTSDGQGKIHWILLTQDLKEIFQAFIKVILAVDNKEITSITTATTKVKQTICQLKSTQYRHDLVHNAKEFKDSFGSLTHVILRRLDDLLCPQLRMSGLQALITTKKLIVILFDIIQNHIRYPLHAHTKACRDSIANNIIELLNSITHSLQRSTIVCDENGVLLHSTKNSTRMSFISNIDSVLTILSPLQRDRFNLEELDSLIQCILEHSITVSQLSENHIKESIMTSCQEVIQHKRDVSDNHKIVVEDPDSKTKRTDWEHKCEYLMDELENLEYQVNMGTLHLIIDIFVDSMQPVESILHSSSTTASKDDLEMKLERFHNKIDAICQVCTLAAECSADENRVCQIRAATQTIELLDTEMGPSLAGCYRPMQQEAAPMLFHVLSSHCAQEISAMIEIIDEITEPNAFVGFTVSRLKTDITSLKRLLGGIDPHPLKCSAESFLMRTMRAINLVKNNNNQLESEELSTLLKQVHKAAEAASACTKLITDTRESHNRLYKHIKIVLHCMEQLNEYLTESQLQDSKGTLQSSSEIASKEVDNYSQSTLMFAQQHPRRSLFHSHNSKISSTLKEHHSLKLELTDILDEFASLPGGFSSDSIETQLETVQHPEETEGRISVASTEIPTFERLKDIEMVVQKIIAVQLNAKATCSKTS